MQLGVVAHMAAGDHQRGKAQDILPAVPAVKAEQHIAANGKVQLCPGIFPSQFFHREHRIVAVSGSGLLDLPAADLQLRDSVRILFQCMEAAAHFQPQCARRRGLLLEGRKPGRHHHHLIRLHAGSGSAQIVQVAVMGRVKCTAVEKNFHFYFSRSA